MYYYTIYFEVGVGLLRTHFLEHALSSLPLFIQFVSNPQVWRWLYDFLLFVLNQTD
jgi:hypothetical protein